MTENDIWANSRLERKRASPALHNDVTTTRSRNGQTKSVRKWQRAKWIRGNKLQVPVTKRPMLTTDLIAGRPKERKSKQNMRRWPNIGLLLAHRLRRWANSKPALGQRLMVAGYSPTVSLSITQQWNWPPRLGFCSWSYRSDGNTDLHGWRV